MSYCQFFILDCDLFQNGGDLVDFVWCYWGFSEYVVFVFKNGIDLLESFNIKLNLIVIY